MKIRIKKAADSDYIMPIRVKGKHYKKLWELSKESGYSISKVVEAIFDQVLKNVKVEK